MWGRKRQKKPPEDTEGAEPLLADIIPFVKLEPIVLPVRLVRKTDKPGKGPPEDEDEARLDNILKDFLVGQASAHRKLKDITNKTHK